MRASFSESETSGTDGYGRLVKAQTSARVNVSSPLFLVRTKESAMCGQVFLSAMFGYVHDGQPTMIL